jgi:hypothetical protein
MSTFEFVLILFAIIIGFGISEILQGWGDQLRSGRTFSALQVVASAYVLLMSLRSLWMLWSARDVAWDYGEYLLAALQPLLFALAARIVRYDPTSERSALEQYLARRRSLFGVLAIFPVVLVTRSLLWNTGELPDAGVELYFVLTSSSILLAVFCWLAWSANPRHHWLGLGVLWLVNLVWSVFVQPSLSVA